MKPDSVVGSEVYKAMQQLTSAMSVMSKNETEEGLLLALLDEHRTLQQSFFRAFHNVAKKYAETPYYDLRNEASVEYAKKIAEIDHLFPYV